MGMANFDTFFDQWAPHWWNNHQRNPFALLHQFNVIRLDYLMMIIKDQWMNALTPQDDFSMLDIGCGAGMLCEPLARTIKHTFKGDVRIVGIDESKQSIAIATQRCIDQELNITYHHTTLDDFSSNHDQFDVVVASEVVEHVEDLRTFLRQMVKKIKPHGLLFITTLNRSLWSYITAITLAQHLLRFVPPKTHDWNLFIKPKELTKHLQSLSVEVMDMQPVQFHLLSRSFSYGHHGLTWPIDRVVNYMMVGKV
jgi:2-polyprenyl-6-hydroxyphenyl methylase/3-demethylubiquinone-9 3-methyltransferase